MQAANHLLELAHLPAVGSSGEAGVGREIADSAVAPVVGQTQLDQVVLDPHVVHRQELHRRDPQLEQMVQDRIRRQAQIGAALVLRHAGMLHGHPPDMALVDHGVGPGLVGPAVTLPVERRIYHDAARQVRRRIVSVRDKGPVLPAHGVRQHGMPCHRTTYGAGSRIEKQLGGIAAMAGGRVELAVHPVTVMLPRGDAGHGGGPAAFGGHYEVQPALLRAARSRLKEDQLHPRGAGRVQDESGGPRCPECTRSQHGLGRARTGCRCRIRHRSPWGGNRGN